MGGIVKIYGIIFICLIGIFLMINMNTRIFIEDDIFESSRTTQLSTLNENLYLGELFANGEYRIEIEDTIDSWIKNFKINKDTKLTYVVDIIDIHESPPAIAVRIRGYSDLLLSEDALEIDYTNVVMLTERKD